MKQIAMAVFGILGIFGSCSKDKKIGPQTVPSSLFFIIKKNNAILNDATLDNMKLFYFKGGTKTYVSDFQRGTGEGHNLGVQTSRNIGFISGDENIKDYYLEFQSGDIDTLFINYRHVGESEAFNNSCYCYYPIEGVKYNGVLASPDPTITQQKVYLFEKL